MAKSKDPRERLIGAAVQSEYYLIVLSRDMDDPDLLICGWWDEAAQEWDTIDNRELRHVQDWVKAMPVLIEPADD